MTPIRETIARVAMDARVHDLAPNVGDLIVGSEFVQSCFGDDGDDGPFFRSAYGLTIAKAVLRALEAEGWRVVPTEPDQRMVGAYITSVRGMPREDRRLRDLTHKEWSKQHAEKCAFRWRAMLAAAPKVTE